MLLSHRSHAQLPHLFPTVELLKVDIANCQTLNKTLRGQHLVRRKRYSPRSSLLQANRFIGMHRDCETKGAKFMCRSSHNTSSFEDGGYAIPDRIPVFAANNIPVQASKLSHVVQGMT
jgi:hypothetical protein